MNYGITVSNINKYKKIVAAHNMERLILKPSQEEKHAFVNQTDVNIRQN